MIRVLVVDDEILARVGIQSILENCGDIRVAGAFGLAGDALDFLKTNIVDIVITDIEMPYMSGLEFIRKIREQHLAEGIIILSCYDKFEYAKEAISLGTDGYLLKNSINQETIEKEIHRVYEMISQREARRRPENDGGPQPDQGGIKAVAIFQMPENGKQQMAAKLVNDIVAHYRMGYLIESVHGRSPFVIFEFPEEADQEARRELLEGYTEAILKNIFQYTNEMPYLAVSREFQELQGIPKGYEEAEDAAQMRFYKKDTQVFYAKDIRWSQERPGVLFDKKEFTGPEGIGAFERQLRSYLDQCRRERIRPKTVKEILTQSVSIFIYSVLREYFTDREIVWWNNRYPAVDTVISAKSADGLLEGLTKMMAGLRRELAEKLDRDGFFDVLDYIDKHCSARITLKELAEFKNMSVSLFIKKFKARTNMAPVQYINQKKIELVKEYLKEGTHTLGEIAELTGFSNENYMVRVFRKTTGKTITDYRKERVIGEAGNTAAKEESG
ncbi:MAG TPA: response regulator [Candidatus Limivivens intestinipullorum]|uniref:Stage 0 sporulation protein A homolog n=1 Tax=Candidatus Limivivens intestinipullorum TaxID=2840858 RepID=A0A9D1EQE7_9FIRM|nr:response regulator [Candidatus Limivivens intestinipullorum]